MNLQDITKSTKRFFKWSDFELSRFMGISRSQITKIHNGYWEGISCDVIKRISQLFHISIDELLDNSFLPPTYHVASHTHSIYIQAPDDYPEFMLKKDDFLYIRPFVHEAAKLGYLVVYSEDNQYRIKEYTKDDESRLILYYIVGISRSYHRSVADIKWKQYIEPKEEKRGAPIKL